MLFISINVWFCINLSLVLIIAINYCDCVLCPPQSYIPCTCNTTTREISCRGPDIPIDDVFIKLTEFIPESHRDFDTFYLNSRSVNRLEANQFKGIRFRTVFLGGSKLTHIHRDAFFGTHLHIKELLAFATNLSLSEDTAYDLFGSISLLRNLQKLVISGSNIHSIPDRAFKPRNEDSIQRNLSEIELGLGVSATISSIGSEAFASLPALRTLSLSSHRINHIKTRAFSFNEPSNKTLVIDLTANHLDDSSIEFGAFSGAKRPVKIYLGRTGCNKNITFLNQTVFEPFLNENPLNMIDIGRGCVHISCDHRMQWIWNTNYELQIKNIKCKDGNRLTGHHLKDRKNESLEKTGPTYLTPTTTPLKPKPNVSTRTLNVDENDNNEVDDYEYEYYEPKDKLCLTDECYEISIEMKKYLNQSLNPCDNFYDYACGGWKDSHLLEYLVQLLTNGGVEYDNFVKLRQQIDTNLDAVLSEAAEENELNIIKQTINMYQKCKRNDLAHIDRLMARLDAMGGWPIISYNTSTDKQHSDFKWKSALVYIISFIRKDILLNFDYVINEKSVKQLKISHSSFILSSSKLMDMKRKIFAKDISAYAKYIHDVAVLLGANRSNQTDNTTIDSVLDIIMFESELAKISEKSTGKEFQIERQLKSLKCLIPEVDWTEIITKILANHNMSFDDFAQQNVILDLHYLIRLSKLLNKTNPVTIQNYLAWRTVETLGFLTGGPQFLEYQLTFHDIQSNERTKILWKQCLSPLKEHLHYVLTRKYAKTFLTESDKLQVTEIVETVKEAFIDLIRQKDWLEHKNDFISKVENIKENIGYPNWLFNDQEFNEFHQNLFPHNSVNQSQELTDFYINLWTHSTKQFLSTIGKVVNKTYDWDQSPLYVGASYDIIDNLITLPIGLLQPPFYDTNRPAYINFGSIGSFVGHEISHASMPRYDSEELLMDPWNESNIKLFLSKAKCFVDQYSSYFDQSSDMNLDGMKTFEEDIGDIAGLKASFNAFNNLIKQNKKVYNDIKLLPSFTKYSPQQLFFLSYAQKWCRYITPTQVRIKILRGVHSPEKYRVNGALSNFNEFGQAFDCPFGSNMNPEVKCEMW